jgi:hypothetical protein
MPLELLPMLYEETPYQDIPHQETSRLKVLRCESIRPQTRLRSVAVLIIGVGIALLASSSTTLAQRGGGGAGAIGPTGGRNAAPVICLYDCPALRDGLSSEDSLKNFRRVMAVQATEEQRAAFARISKYIQAASDQLESFRESLQKEPASRLAEGKLSDNTTAITQAIGKVLASNHNFLTSFSAAQETGLKETTKKLAIVESDLDRQSKTFDQIVHSAKLDGEQIAAGAANLDKALASFQNEHLALGNEMSIIFPPGGEELSFNFPLSTNTTNVAGETVSIPASGVVSRISSNASSTVVDKSHNLFHLKLTADLADLQQNITALLRSRLNRDPRCGERITIQQASFTPLAAAGLVAANVHYERWVCPLGPVRGSSMEVTSGEGEIEIKLSASVDPKTGLLLVPEISRVTAAGSLRDLLRSGDLGVTLRDGVAASLLSALQKTADLQTALPPAVQQSATLQKAQFQETGVDQLSLVLEGQLQLSDAQLGQFTDQLQQRQSAKGAPAP